MGTERRTKQEVGGGPEEAPSSEPDAAAPWTQLAGVAGWVLGVLVLGLLILAVLARLPPLQ